MSTGSNSAAARVLASYRRQGMRIVLRSMTTFNAANMGAETGHPVVVSGEVLRNPPLITAPRVPRAALIDAATALPLLYDAAQGVLVEGDRLRVVGQADWSTITATVPVTAATGDPLALPSTLTDIEIDVPLTGDLGGVDTTFPVEFAWVADTLWWARVSSVSDALVNGINILSGDLRVTIPAHGLAKPPKIGDRILPPAGAASALPDEVEVITCSPTIMPGGQVAGWSILAR